METDIRSPQPQDARPYGRWRGGRGSPRLQAAQGKCLCVVDEGFESVSVRSKLFFFSC